MTLVFWEGYTKFRGLCPQSPLICAYGGRQLTAIFKQYAKDLEFEHRINP